MNRMNEWRRVAQAGKEHDPAWYRVHRRISIYLTWAMLKLGLEANQVSGLMMVLGVAGALLVATPSPLRNALGFVLFYAAFLLDKVDGEMARLRRAPSARGILLDRFHHRIVEPTLFAAAAFHEVRLTGSADVLVAGFVTMLLANIIEENQQLPPFIFFKHLREGGRLPEAPLPKPSRHWARANRALRPLKAFRMLIVALPLIALTYVLEGVFHHPFTAYYLEASAVALAVCLAFQCIFYFVHQLDFETQTMAAALRAHARTVLPALPSLTSDPGSNGAHHATRPDRSGGVRRRRMRDAVAGDPMEVHPQ